MSLLTGSFFNKMKGLTITINVNLQYQIVIDQSDEFALVSPVTHKSQIKANVLMVFTQMKKKFKTQNEELRLIYVK